MRWPCRLFAIIGIILFLSPLLFAPNCQSYESFQFPGLNGPGGFSTSPFSNFYTMNQFFPTPTWSGGFFSRPSYGFPGVPTAPFSSMYLPSFPTTPFSQFTPSYWTPSYPGSFGGFPSLSPFAPGIPFYPRQQSSSIGFPSWEFSPFGAGPSWPVSSLPWSPVSQRPQGPQITYTIETDKGIYDLNESIEITFKVRNKGDGAAQINFSSEQRFDVIVKDSEGEKVWQLSDGQVYAQDQGTVTINAGASKTFTAQWDEEDTGGNAVPLGSYLIQAFLTATDTRYQKSASTHIGIRTLPTFASCQELKEKLQELIQPYTPPSYYGGYGGMVAPSWPGFASPYFGYGPGSFGGGFGFSGGYAGQSFGFAAPAPNMAAFGAPAANYYQQSFPLYGGAETGGGGGGTQHSTTNTQVAGVDEADVIKNDGSHIYMIKGKTVRIIKAFPVGEMEELPRISFANTHFSPTQLYVDGNILAVIGEEKSQDEPIYYPEYGPGYKSAYYYPLSPFTRVFIFDITDRGNVIQQRSIKFEAQYLQSRKVDDILYVIMNGDPPYELLDQGETDVRKLIPIYSDSAKHADNEGEPVCDCEEIAFLPGYTEPNYLIVAAIPVDDPGKDTERELILGRSENVYSSRENLYVTSTSYIEEDYPAPSSENPDISIPAIYIDSSSTMIYKFSFESGSVHYADKAKVPGTVLNQFSMDEYGNHFRIATTTDWPSSNNLYILDNQMKLTGFLEDIALDERIKSVRFMGDKAYVVTFRNIDPFFVVSLADPANPEILGELKIPGYSDYLHPYNDTHIVGFGRDIVNNREAGIKISLFDVSDVAHPIELDKEVIGYMGTDSELLQDHKALLFSTPLNLMAFPITVTQRKSGSSYEYEYKYTFQGAYIYYIDENGFVKEAEITHYSTGTFPTDYIPYEGKDNVRRVIYISDHYYTISASKVKAIHMETYTQDNVLNLQ